MLDTIQFGTHKATHSKRNDGDQWKFNFPNGYGASVIRNQYSYGGPEGFFELAVFLGGELCYTTPITNDVLGWLTSDDHGSRNGGKAAPVHRLRWNAWADGGAA